MAQWIRAELRQRGAALLMVSIVIGLAGCAAAGGRSGPTIRGTLAEVNALEEEISVQQGLISGSAECFERCRAASSICDSASRICAVAADLAELEALESCRRAESACSDARNRVALTCECP